jgi:hypothetical protein
MKDWVKPYLLKEQYGPFKRDYEDKEWVYFDLLDYLNHDFGHFNIGDTFGQIFGSVLADLPQEAFEKICNMNDVVFIFIPSRGAEVKIFRTGVKKGERLRVVIFPHTSFFQPPKVLKGEIVHELAHVFLEHYHPKGEPKAKYEDNEIERQADQTAIDWGFNEEICSLRDYIAKQEGRTCRE